MQMVLEFEKAIPADLPFPYRGLIYLLGVLDGTNSDGDLTSKRHDPKWLETFHRWGREYLVDLNGMAGTW